MYSFKGRIRFSEVDSNLFCKLSSILSYFQDCSVFHSESVDHGVERCKEHGIAWILSSWQIIVERYPKLGEEVTVSTWACGFKGFFGFRNFKMEDASGNMLAYAYTNWIYMDLKHGHPTRVTPEVAEAYKCEAPLEMDIAPRKIPIPESGISMDPIAVRRSDIDSNEHVNNERYVLIAEEYLPDGFQTRQLRAEYKNAAVYGDIIYPTVSTQGKKITVTLNDKDNTPYAIVEFENFY